MRNKPEWLRHVYSLRFTENRDYRNAVWKVLCSSYFARYIPRRSGVLDLGAGWGEFINNIEAGDKIAMDLNPGTSDHLASGVRFINQDCSERWMLPSQSVDVVFTSNFLEHLPCKDDLEGTLSEAYRSLRTPGLVICLGPNVKYLNGTYWDFWDHHIPLSELSVSELLQATGFSVDVCIPRFLPFSMSIGATPPVTFLRLYLKLPFLWPLFGRQFLVIGTKRSVFPTESLGRGRSHPAALAVASQDAPPGGRLGN